jgi:hypothetical protein
MPSPKPRGHLTNRSTSAPFRDRGSGADDQEVAGWLDRLDRLLSKTAATVPEQIAAYVRLDPDLPDSEIARSVRGVRGRRDAAALVARVRGNLAAGHDPGRGLPDVVTAERVGVRRHRPARRPRGEPWRPPMPTSPPPRPRARECMCGAELAPTEAGCCVGCAVMLVVELGHDHDKIAAFYGDAARLDAALDA